MTKRPRSHVLEDESVLAFRAALPPRWIFRPEEKDYGIDGSVEVVDEAGNVLGQRFYVQLKATDRANLPDAFKVTLTRAAADYYGNVDLPTLLIRYHAPTRTLLFRWFHDLDPYYVRLGKKTVSFALSEADRWTPDTQSQLLTELDNCRWIRSPHLLEPIVLSLEIERSTISPGRANELAREIERAAQVLGIVIREVAPSPVRGKIIVRSRETAAHLPSGKRATLHYKKGLLEVLSVQALAADTLAALALALGQAHHNAQAKSILQASFFRSTFICQPRIVVAVSAIFAADKCVSDLVALANDLEDRACDHHACDEIRGIAMVLSPRPFSNDEWVEISKQFDRWLDLARKGGDRKRLAVTYYNCGHFYGAHAGPREARFDYYRKAARCDHSYRSRYYFWAEIGATLFDQGRFKWAAKAYEKSVSLGAPAEFVARYADALLHTGAYAAADSVFADYLGPDHQEAHWALTARAPLLIRKYTGLESQRRAPARAAEILEAAAPPKDSSQENREAAIQALKQDALHPEAWYLLGWATQATKAWDEAAWCFTLAAVFERPNVHAWTSALLMCLNAKIGGPLFPYLLISGYRIHQGNLYREMADELRRNFPPEAAEEAVRRLKETLESLPPEVVPREIRVLKDDGSFDIVNLAQLLEH